MNSDRRLGTTCIARVTAQVFLLIMLFVARSDASAADRWITPGTLAVISFKDDGTPLVVPVTVDGVKYSFALDTNSTSSLIDKSLTGRLKNLGGDSLIRTSGGSIVSSKHEVTAFCIADVPCKSVSALRSVDLRPFTKILGLDIHGIVGMDALRPYIIQVDFDSESIMIVDPSLANRPPGARIPMVLDDQSFPCISGRLRGLRYATFRLDTGLTTTGCVNFEDFKTLYTTGDLVGTHVNARMVLGDGSEVVVERGRSEELVVAEHSHVGLVLSPGPSNALGRSYLRRYRVTFDFKGGHAYFDPSSKFTLRDRGDYDGIVIDQHKTVVRVVDNSIAHRAGLRTGDRLLEVDGVDTGELSWEAINAALCFSRTKDLKLRVRREQNVTEITIPGG